jgi:hypothetical protein
VIVPLQSAAAGTAAADGGRWAADGLAMAVRPLLEEADWRSDAELLFSLEQGLALAIAASDPAPADATTGSPVPPRT